MTRSIGEWWVGATVTTQEELESKMGKLPLYRKCFLSIEPIHESLQFDTTLNINLQTSPTKVIDCISCREEITMCKFDNNIQCKVDPSECVDKCDFAKMVGEIETKNLDQTIKSDAGKLQLSLVPTQAIRDIAEIRMYGNAKYHDSESWRRVEPQRYIDALYRHLIAVIDDPMSVDEESGLSHVKHIACNAAFLCELLKEMGAHR